MTEKPPTMFRRPSDPQEPLPLLRASEEVVRLHTEWARAQEAPEDRRSMVARLRYRAAGVALRLAGGANHLGDLIRAVDTVAARVDELTNRLHSLATTTDDLARALSEEVSQLRADVQRMAASHAGEPPQQSQ